MTQLNVDRRYSIEQMRGQFLNQGNTAESKVSSVQGQSFAEILEQKKTDTMTWGRITEGWISMDYILLDKTEDSAPQTVTGKVKVNDYLRVRSGPSTSYAIAGYLSNNTTVEILEQKTVGSTLWGRIDKGWISLDYVVLDGQASSPVTKTVTADCLRVRANAGTSHAIVGYLYSGAKVQITQTKDVNGTTWGKVDKGWVSLDYVK